ncbi:MULTISPECIES: WxL domain-containing protein [Listeria]|uniref:WxL domain-containing protein n=1 Tax=Listeria TaxID=1637 RepID=UPI000B58DB9D|nr:MULTISPECIES: WxL domain-containing protein [Listeria]
MCKLKWSTSLLTILVGCMTFSGNAFAVGTETNADVTFQADDTGVTPPIDPTDPGADVTPTEPVNPTSGALRIDFAAALNFGTQKISGEAKNYNALYTEVTTALGGKKYVPNFVQVTDNRGSNSGWSLSVSGTEFVSASHAVLEGAALTMSGVHLTSTMDSKFTPSVVATDVTLNASGQNLVTARENEGMATWAIAFGNLSGADELATNPNVSLHIPAEARKIAGETYTSTITWTLEATP